MYGKFIKPSIFFQPGYSLIFFSDVNCRYCIKFIHLLLFVPDISSCFKELVFLSASVFNDEACTNYCNFFCIIKYNCMISIKY